MFRELIQNADDARAENIEICFEVENSDQQDGCLGNKVRCLVMTLSTLISFDNRCTGGSFGTTEMAWLAASGRSSAR